VEESAFLEADIDEGGLNAGKDRFNPSEVDVADDAPVVWAVHQQLDQTVVLDYGHAGFPLAPVDQNFALHAGKPRPQTRSSRRPGGQGGANSRSEMGGWPDGPAGRWGPV
jgi:hypothetical protein